MAAADNLISSAVLALNEQWRPLQGIDVEMYNTLAPASAALAVATTNNVGIATFTDIVAGDTDTPLVVAYRLKVTRSSTKDASGVSRLQVLEPPPVGLDVVTDTGTGSLSWNHID